MIKREHLWFLFSGLLALATVFQTSSAEAQRFCPPGYVRGRFGRCMPAVARPVMCPAGYVLDRFGRCALMAPQPRMCPPGYIFFRGRCRLR